MNQDSCTATLPIGPPSSQLSYAPIASPSKDTSNEYRNSQGSLYNQNDFQTAQTKKKSKLASISKSLPISNAIENLHTFNQAIVSSNRDHMIPTMDAMPIEQSFALVQMLLNQQQVDHFQSMNMGMPNVTTSAFPSSIDSHNIPDAETEWNFGSSDQEATTTMPTIMESTKSNILPSSLSLLSLSTLEKSSRVSKELASCNSLNSISAMSTGDMKDVVQLLDKKNQTWFV